MIKNIRKAAVIAAHPDDEVLGCGGTINKLFKLEVKTDVLILGEGITARRKNRDIKQDKSAIKKLRKNSKKANRILGTNSIVFKEFPDNRFDSVDLLDIIKVIEKFLSESKPDAVFTHHYGDLNIDHQIANRSVLTACRPVSSWSPDMIFTFDVLSSTEWFWGAHSRMFKPNFFVDVAAHLEAKKAALRCYFSEYKEFPSPRSEDAVEHQAGRYGAMVNQRASEAFELIYCRS